MLHRKAISFIHTCVIAGAEGERVASGQGVGTEDGTAVKDGCPSGDGISVTSVGNKVPNGFGVPIGDALVILLGTCVALGVIVGFVVGVAVWVAVGNALGVVVGVAVGISVEVIGVTEGLVLGYAVGNGSGNWSGIAVVKAGLGVEIRVKESSRTETMVGLKAGKLGVIEGSGFSCSIIVLVGCGEGGTAGVDIGDGA